MARLGRKGPTLVENEGTGNLTLDRPSQLSERSISMTSYLSHPVSELTLLKDDFQSQRHFSGSHQKDNGNSYVALCCICGIIKGRSPRNCRMQRPTTITAISLDDLY